MNNVQQTNNTRQATNEPRNKAQKTDSANVIARHEAISILYRRDCHATFVMTGDKQNSQLATKLIPTYSRPQALQGTNTSSPQVAKQAKKPLILNSSFLILNLKKTLILFFLLSTLSVSSLHAQVETRGRSFLVSFAANYSLGITPEQTNLQIRIVADREANVTLTFNGIAGSGRVVNFTVAANTTYTHVLSPTERSASYNNTQGASNKSVLIHSDVPVSAYAFNQLAALADATNLLPIPALSNNYYHVGVPTETGSDQYMAIATQDNTIIYENGTQVGGTLSAGQVYFKSWGNMTGHHITSNNPIAYFAAHQFYINKGGGDNVFQQLTPVNTWGRRFIVPVSRRQMELVRVIASQDGTTITQTGARIADSWNSPAPATITLNAGQWVEWRVLLSGNGCYIESDKPIQVCALMVGNYYGSPATSGGDEAFVWVPPVEQFVDYALVAPFAGGTLNDHYVLIVTPTATKDNTTISTAGGAPTPLSGGTWHENAASGMSFYNMPIENNSSISHIIENPAELVVYGYGFGHNISYYYVAAAALRNLESSFYINDIHYQDIDGASLCDTIFNIRADILFTLSPASGRIKGYINNVEQTSARDQLTWSIPTLPVGSHNIKMVARSSEDVDVEQEATINIIAATAPGTINGDQSLCGSGTPATITSTTPGSGGGTITYLWEQSTDNGTTWGVAPGTNTGLTYAPGTVSTTTQYRRRATGSCGSVYSNVVTITVAPVVTPGAIADAQTICHGATPTTLTSTTAATNYTSYQWQHSTDGGTTWNPAPGTNNAATYSPPALTATTQYRRSATNSCGSANTSVVTITVTPLLSSGAIAADTTICHNTAPNTLTSVTPATGGTVTYQWERSTDGGTTWNDISGATSATYSPGALTATTRYRRKATNGCNNGTSNTVIITVTAITTPGTIGKDTTICHNTAPSTLSSVTPAAGGAITYLWEQSTDNGTTWNPASGTNNAATYSPGALTATTQYRRRAIGSCGTGNSNTVVITVAPVLTAGAIGSNQTVCSGATPAALTSVTNAAGGIGTITYLWEQSTDGGSTWAAASGTNNAATYSPPDMTATTHYRRSATNACGAVRSNTVVITEQQSLDVYPAADISAIMMTGNAVTITAGIVNQGTVAIGPPVHVTMYENSASAANKINHVSANITINPGDTGYVTLNIANINLHSGMADIVIRVNDNDGTFPAQTECVLNNNILAFPNPAMQGMMKKNSRLMLPTPLSHNGTYPNPVSVLFSEEIEYRLKAVNVNPNAGTVVITDTIPTYLEYVPSSAAIVYEHSPLPAAAFSQGTTATAPARTVLRWEKTNIPSMDSLIVSFRARPQSGASASQPLFINNAMVTIARAPGDSLYVQTNSTYHQGAGISIMTFSAGFGGNIYNAGEQALDYRTNPSSGVLVAPDEGYHFAGWSHDNYTSLRGERISARRGIMHYDTLTVYGNMELRANFVLEDYAIAYYLNGSDNAATNPSAYNVESGAITLSAPAKPGDTFTGWTGSNGDEPQPTVVIPESSTGELTFFANFLHSGREDVEPYITEEKDKAWSVEDELYVRTNRANSIVKIYSLDGVLREQQTIVSPGVTTKKLPRGIYVVTVNNNIGQKVVLAE